MESLTTRIFANFASHAPSNTPMNMSTFSDIGQALSACREFCDDIKCPRIAVIGAQSSGKTSLINRLIGSGESIPTGSDMTTRVPLEISMTPLAVSTNGTQIEMGSYSSSGGWDSAFCGCLPLTPESSTELAGSMQQLTTQFAGTQGGVAPHSIHMRIKGPDCAPITLVDLPGLVTVARQDKGQPKDIRAQIISLADHYLADDESTFILLIMPARVDLETDIAWEIAKRHDPSGERTCVVLTKPDHSDGVDLAKYIATDHGPSSLHAALGYYVAYPKLDETAENEFFNSDSRFRCAPGRVGVRCIASRIGEVLRRSMKRMLPELLRRLRVHEESVEHECSKCQSILTVAKLDGSVPTLSIDEVSTRFALDVYTELFANGSKAGCSIRKGLENIYHEKDASETLKVDTSTVDEIARESHGIHMDIGDPYAEIIETYVRRSHSLLQQYYVSRAVQQIEHTANVIRSLVSIYANEKYKLFPEMRQTIRLATHETLVKHTTIAREEICKVIEAELNYTWVSPRLCDLGTTCSDEQNRIHKERLITCYISATTIALGQIIPKLIVYFVITPFPHEAQTKLQSLGRERSDLFCMDKEEYKHAIELNEKRQNIKNTIQMLEEMSTEQ